MIKMIFIQLFKATAAMADAIEHVQMSNYLWQFF